MEIGSLTNPEKGPSLANDSCHDRTDRDPDPALQLGTTRHFRLLDQLLHLVAEPDHALDGEEQALLGYSV